MLNRDDFVYVQLALVRKDDVCPVCHGRGADWSNMECPECDGLGYYPWATLYDEEDFAEDAQEAG